MVVKPGDKKRIFTSGAFVFFLSAIMFLSIFLINKESSIFGKRVNLKTKVSNVSNLKLGGAVQLRGIKIGSVDSITFQKLDEIIITVSILEEYLTWIKTDSSIAIRTQGVLGDKFIEISGGNESSPNIRAGEYLKAQSSNQFDSFLNKGEDILVVSKRVLQKIDTLLDAFGPEKVQSIVTNLDETTAKLNQMMTPMNQERVDKLLTNFSEASDSIKVMSKSLSGVTSQIEQGPGTLHSLIYDRAIHDDLKSILGGAKRNQVLKYFVRESIKKSNR